MHKTVIKIGGSNLQNIENIRRIPDIIKSYKEPVILVVSAFFGVTDRLEKAVFNNAETVIEHLRNLHYETLNRLLPDNEQRQEARQHLSNCLKELQHLLLSDNRQEVAVANRIMSFGERLSARTLYPLLKANGIKCQLALPEDIGLTSNRRFFQGSILLKKSARNLKKTLSEHTTYIVPGFYGISEQGETVLLGRGGSDYSAACIAHCTGAAFLDVWKDVEGYLSGDPKIIRDVKKISRLSYLEAAELSYFGARILHPRTIRPLVSKNIQIRLLNPEKFAQTKQRQASTVISSQTLSSPEVIKSVTLNDDIALLKLKGSGVGIKKGILAEVTGAFDEAKLNIRSVVTSQTAIHFIFSTADALKAKKIVDNLSGQQDFDTEIENDIAWIAAVGEGINKKEGIAGRIFTALARAEINVQQIVLGASEAAVYFVVKRPLAQQAARIIHKEIFHSFNQNQK